jgi:2-iminobutanoate/2-iminopropanoate deaminase
MASKTKSVKAKSVKVKALSGSEQKQVIDAGITLTGGPFALCVRHNDMVYVSGLPPFPPDYCDAVRSARAAGKPIPAFPDISFERQVRIVMDNMKKLVEAAGSNMDCLLKVIVWMKDQRQQEEFDRIYRTYFSSSATLPARTRMQAGRTPMDCGLEVEAVGYVPQRRRKPARKAAKKVVNKAAKRVVKKAAKKVARTATKR